MAIEITKRPYDKCFSGNPVHYELYSAQAAADSTIFFEVKIRFKYVGGSYADVVTVPYYPVAGTAKVDIKDILHSELEYGLIPFYTDEKTIWAAPEQTGYFYIEFREITTANPEPTWNTTEIDYERFVVKGGLDYFAYRGNNFWVNHFLTNYPFFTWQKNGRLAAPDERIYLAWLNDQDITALNLMVFVIAYYTDGTNSGSNESDFTDPGATRGKMYFIPAGCDQWGLDGLDVNKDIDYWTIQVMDESGGGGSTPVSELFTFYYDRRNDYNNTTLHYRNSLGGLDSVRIRGVIEQGLDYSFSEQQKTVNPDYFDGDLVSPQRVITDNQERLIYKGDIGHLRKEEQDRLRDAFLQREVYWEKNQGKKWLPVIINTKSNKLRSSQDSRWSLPIEFELANTGNNYYTPSSVDLGDGVFNSNVCRAYVSAVAVSTVVSGGNCDASVLMTENDPEGASTQIRYRVIKSSDSSVTIDWTTVAYGTLNFTVPSGFTYIIEIQSLCGVSSWGRKVTAIINGIATSSSSGNSSIINNTSTPSQVVITVDGVTVLNDYLGSYATLLFTQADDADADVVVTLTSLSPSSGTLETNGGLAFPGTVAGNTVTWTAMEIVSGMQIDLY